MEHLQLEVFDLQGTGSKYAVLEQDQSITIVDTSEVFASGDVWSQSFRLNIPANAHIFGSAGEMHGARLHEQINKRRARLWVEGLPLYLGYLKLDDEVEIDGEGNIDINFESGQKTFEEMIEGTSATEVSVGDDVVIGVALNRKRTVHYNFSDRFFFTLDGLAAFAQKDALLKDVCTHRFQKSLGSDISGIVNRKYTAYSQRWPKLVKSHGTVYDSEGNKTGNTLDGDGEPIIDYTNVQTPYDAGHPFCNINICYPLKVTNKEGEELSARGYTVRLAHGKPTTHGGDNETRYNNAPNFYLLYFMDRLFKDLGITITENQAMDVEDLRRVFLLNYGCHYKEIENDGEYFDSLSHETPEDKLERYGQYYMPFIDDNKNRYLTRNFSDESMEISWGDRSWDPIGKVLLRNVEITANGETILSTNSVEGKQSPPRTTSEHFTIGIERNDVEKRKASHSSYLAYATGDNYPHVEINEIVDAMKAMFGVRMLFSKDFATVRIVLLRNVFCSKEVQNIQCDIIDEEKVENSIRGFRMTYGKGNDDTSFFYKGFDDLFDRASKTWKDTSDKHDYSQWSLNANYEEIKQYVSAMNKVCYVTSAAGNAYGVKVDEEEEVLFPSLFEYAGFMDAEDGDCSKPESEGDTVEEVQIGATPIIMNNTGNTYALLFSGEMKAPTPINVDSGTGYQYEHYGWPAFADVAAKIGTNARFTRQSLDFNESFSAANITYNVKGKFDAYSCEMMMLRLEDNYAISNGGTPFDEADPGLCFGVMRSSGSDAFVRYFDDADDDENDTWEVEPGSNAISHPDTCDDNGNQWDYDVEAAERRTTVQNLLDAGWDVSGSPTDEVGYTYHFYLDISATEQIDFLCTPIVYLEPGARPSPYMPYPVMTQAQLEDYVTSLWEAKTWDFAAFDQCKIILNAKTSNGNVLYGNGRFSLKLRAEKLNPYYDKTLPDIVRTKQEAATAMTRIYKTANTDLLDRPIVDNATMRTAGWECPGDGYATVFSIGQGVMYSDGKVHEILWTPIKPNGTVKTPAQMQTYVNSFNNLASSEIITHDTEHLILDIDTSEQRAETLHELQALYYEANETQATPVDIRPVNRRYLEITTPALRGRGLCDQFYKEYSFWVRNARIAKRTVHMELAQLLSIDKTKRVKIGDITGFIRKMQYEVNNKTGLGLVTMEIMYI